MIVHAVPLFTQAHILRREMLLSLADYAFQLGALQYGGYADGVLSGCKLTTTEKVIEVGSGVVVCDGRLYLIQEPISVAYHPTDTLCVCKLHFADAYQTDNFLYREMDLILSEDTQSHKGEIELCRFKLQLFARLRYEYDNFEDRSTEYDTLNTIGAAYSAYGASTLSTEILQEFSRELLNAPAAETIDQTFCLQVLGSNQALSREVIFAYIKIKTGDCPEPSTNVRLYQKLLEILESAEQGTDPKAKKTRRTAWRVALE